MKIYLVGGAVRDKLLGLPVRERDWVVVGAEKQNLIEQGYQQVGKSFPVFLHPQTHEEYALARTEKKTAKGYYGFECNFDPSVTLIEDLARRDLTINAIAQDEQGEYIDPYGGINDLKLRILRHVSPAFVDDPVRLLRVARFLARFASLGFTVAEETLKLLCEMVNAGEMQSLIPERVWNECEQALATAKPAQFFMLLHETGALRVLFPEIAALFNQKSLIEGFANEGAYHLFLLQAFADQEPDPEQR